MYKVLRRENGNLVSCVIGKPSLTELDKGWQITYLPYRWVKAKVGKIIVCKTLDDAQHVRDTEYAHEIWRCKTKKAMLLPFLASLADYLFKVFWEGSRPLSEFFERLNSSVPIYGADRIMLTKRIWPK